MGADSGAAARRFVEAGNLCFTSAWVTNFRLVTTSTEKDYCKEGDLTDCAICSSQVVYPNLKIPLLDTM